MTTGPVGPLDIGFFTGTVRLSPVCILVRIVTPGGACLPQCCLRMLVPVLQRAIADAEHTAA